MTKTNIPQIGIVGGGASGFFTAIQLAKHCYDARIKASIKIFEATPHFLKKVSISGGGRCNVTHREFEVSRFCQNYPRGKKELKSPFQEFQALDTVKWFSERGIQLVAEEDGRMFPKSNRSSSVIECFKEEAEKYGVESLKNHKVQSARFENDRFQIQFAKQEAVQVDYLVLATGSSPSGYRLAKSLALNITDLAPSLFSFKISSKLLRNLSGISFENVDLKLKIKGHKDFKQSGPMLITHWGLSGPAILKLSAWAAREMKEVDYKAVLAIHWLPEKKLPEIESFWQSFSKSRPKMNIGNCVPEFFSKRFWHNFVEYLDIDLDKNMNELSKKEHRKIIDSLYCSNLEIDGKNRYKDEFVECGGVGLKQINFKSMEVKSLDKLYITGELLDIDGITGGFNFQNAWTGGYLAAKSIFEKLKLLRA
ncbi:MAG: NAD(P)/FAD-dependent oxidoreductase [Bdellovibrionota bacterium]|nr:aminoacetone oxidase family FAD-binding enzyme [Pseudobdellovibrionaceae bacterium]|tara:strand:- start:2979 stop:4247 length:1269 start_codon:yes stop_codon:yes gene_type:complete